MRKRVRVVLMAGLVLGLVVPTVVADELATVEKKLTAAWKQHKSVTVKLTMVTKMEQPGFAMDSKAEGTQEVLKKGDKILYRMDMATSAVQKVGDQEMKSQSKTTAISDGAFLYMLTETDGQKMAFKSKADPQQAGDPTGTFKLLREHNQLKLLPEEETDGQKAYVIEAIPKEAAGPQATRTVIYYSQEHGVLLKSVTYDASGKPMSTMTCTDYKFDVKIDPQRFVFKAPEGVQVIDQTAAQP